MKLSPYITLEKNLITFPNIQIIGKSVASRAIYAAMLGSPQASNRILFSAGIHGREYLNCFVLCRLMLYWQKHLTELNHHDTVLYFLPNLNPDGICYSMSTRPKWKSNQRGVDLNRNFPAGFHPQGHPGYKGYSGPYPASEPETRAVLSFLHALPKPFTAVHLHSRGQVIYWDYHVPMPQRGSHIRLMNLARQATHYRPVYDSPDTKANGGLGDYCAYALHIPTITIETGRYKTPVPIYQRYEIYNTTLRLSKSLILPPLPRPGEKAVAEPAAAPNCSA